MEGCVVMQEEGGEKVLTIKNANYLKKRCIFVEQNTYVNKL